MGVKNARKKWIFLFKPFKIFATSWSDGYFAASIGNASNETVKKYIEEQG